MRLEFGIEVAVGLKTVGGLRVIIYIIFIYIYIYIYIFIYIYIYYYIIRDQ